jgi:DNA-binding CsgD family transcriptional regulator
MHGRAARLLAAAGATGEQICGHLVEAAPMGDARVVETLRGAARRALARGVPASAVAYLERALREPPLPGAQADVLAELGRAEAIAGRPESLPHLEAAITLVDDVRERARLLLEFGRALHHSGRLTDACAAFHRGLDELEQTDADNGELRVELEGGYLNAALFAPDRAADAHARAHDIMTRADRLSSHAELALLSKAMMMQLWEGGPRDVVLRAAHRLLSEGRLSEEDAAGAQTAWHVIATLGWCDDYTAAHDALRRAQADSRRRGSVLAYALACVFRSRHGLWTGPVGDAVHDARAALDILPAESVYVCSAAYCLACGLLEEGHGDEAEGALQSADQQQPAAPPFFTAWREMAHGRLAAHRGEDELALEAFLAAGQHHAELRIVNPAVLPWRSEAGLAAHRLHRPDLAHSLIDEELALAESFGGPRAVGVARRAAGLLAHGDAAVDLLRRATEALAACGALVEQARAMTDLGAAIRRDGRPAEARPILRQALRLAEEVGATVVGRMAGAELRVAGGRGPTRTSRPNDPLTPSERRIAELAAAGRGNRQIANALFITVKSVEWHLGNAYRKLGISGRAELTGALDGAVNAPG